MLEVKKEESAASVDAKERRINPRYSVSAIADAVHLQADTRLNGRVSDLSRGGCYIDTINPFPVGADVKIRITKGNASLLAQAKVLYAATGMGMGLAFTKIDPERMPVLEEWLRELSGESPPESKALEDDPAPAVEGSSSGESKYVLNELIVTLIRKRVLTESEGNVLLKKLMA